MLAIVGLLALSACTEELAPRRDGDAETPHADADLDAESDAEAGADAAIDAVVDQDADASARADAGDGSTVPDSGSSCEQVNAAIDRFVAAHNTCSTDSDCAIVGDCSHADWRAIAAPFAAEANQMVRASQCFVNDGPGANAVCNKGKCAVTRSSLWCGSARETACPTGSKRVYAGCGMVASTFTEGCRVSCTLDAGTPCAPGYTCQTTTVDPCHATESGQPTCAACGMQTMLCLPAPSCELKLSVAWQGARTVTTIRQDESTVLELWLENLTDKQLDVSFDIPCHGPAVSGLSNYDLWNSCLAGVCQSETQRVQLTLAARERKPWRSAVVSAGATDCNMQGLAAGTYRPSFSLGVTGATTCGPEAAELTVTR